MLTILILRLWVQVILPIKNNNNNKKNPTWWYYSIHGYFPLAGGRRGSYGGSTHDEEFETRSATSSRFDADRPRPGALEIDSEPFHYGRHPFPERDYGRSFGGSHFDDSYVYDDAGSGLKRTYSMMVSGGRYSIDF